MFDNLSLKKIDKNLASFQLRKTSKQILSSKKSNNLITLCNPSCVYFHPYNLDEEEKKLKVGIFSKAFPTFFYLGRGNLKPTTI